MTQVWVIQDAECALGAAESVNAAVAFLKRTVDAVRWSEAKQGGEDHWHITAFVDTPYLLQEPRVWPSEFYIMRFDVEREAAPELAVA